MAFALGAILCAPLQAAASGLPSLQVADRSGIAADVEGVREVLVELDRLSTPSVDHSAIARAIERQGYARTPVLLQLLEHGRSGDRPLLLTERRVLKQALAGWGRSAVMPFVRERALLDGDARTWEVLLLVLAEVGGSSDLEFAAEIAARALTGPHLPFGVGVALRGATGDILARDHRSMLVIREQLLSLDRRIGILLARAVGDSGLAAGAELLSRLLGFVPFSDRALLKNIGRAGRELAHPVGSAITDAVRLYLYSEDIGLVQEAALCLGALEDHDAIETLTNLLDHESFSIRNASHAALTQITGLRFSPDSTRWRSWYSLEYKWFEARATVLLNQLGDEDPVVVAKAIREITSHLLQRPMFAREIERVLQRREPYLRALACSALGQVGGRAQLRALETCSNDCNEKVVAAARKALERLPGVDPASDSRTTNVRPTPRRNPTSRRSRQ